MPWTVGNGDYMRVGRIWIHESDVPTNLGGMWLGAAGKIGIGTNTPESLLHLSAATASDDITDPIKLKIHNTTTAGDWSITQPWGLLEFDTDDVNHAGSGPVAGIGCRMESAPGGDSSLCFYTDNDLGNDTVLGAASERMCIDSDGNVGIGTTTPATALEVNGDIGIGRVAGGYTFREVVGGDVRAAIKSNATNDLILSTGGDSEALRILNNGNVGIGTNDPQVDLEIENVNGSPELRFTDPFNGSLASWDARSNVLGEISWYSRDVQLTNSYAKVASITSKHFDDGFPDGALCFTTSSNGVLNEDAMVIDHTGNVGIGTNAPDKLLHLEGSVPTLRFVDTDGSVANDQAMGGLEFYSRDLTGDDFHELASIRCLNDYSAGSAPDGALVFSTSRNVDVRSGEVMRIDPRGYVGIGVTDPDSKLEVRGTVQASLSDTNHGMFLDHNGTLRRDYGSDGAGFHFTSNAIWPTDHNGSYANDEIDLGNTSYRYKTIWSNNSLNSTSDDRLKHNEEEVADALGTIKKLKLLKYDKTGEMLAPDYNGDLTGISHKKELGFIAQSVLEIPELSFLVTVPGDPEDTLEHGLKRGVEPYGMEYQGINNLLVQAVQELSAKNDSLEARILALENA